MSVPNKHIEKAERLLHKGKLDAALEEYLQAWKENPADTDLVQTVAELYLRLNKIQESRKCFAYLFDAYAEQNDYSKALEFFRRMQRFGPVEPARLIRCAQLLEKPKPNEAIEHYRLALDAVVGQNPELALQCLHGLANLQPSSVEIQARMASVALKLGKPAQATLAYHKVGLLRMAEGRFGEAVEALEEAFRLQGAPTTVRLDLARCCIKAGRFARVISVLGEGADSSKDPEVLELLGQAYLAEKQFEKAEGVYQKVLEDTPAAVEPLLSIAMEYISRGSVPQGLRTIKGIEQQLLISRQERVLEELAEKLSRFEDSPLPVVEYVARLSDRLHRDSPLARSLNRLFDLYCDAGEFAKAADALEQLIAIDIYAPECADKLQRLEGKMDRALWRELASRMGKYVPTDDLMDAHLETAQGETQGGEQASKPEEGGSNLRDLILQAEIFLQYKLDDKARERLQRIAKLFPREDERNEDVRLLFERAHFKPAYAAAAAPVVSSAPSARSAEPEDIRSQLGRVSEVSRDLSRQSTVKGVLSTAVNDVGRLWQASRCVVGLLTPNRPPSMALEYISPGVQPSDPMLLGKLLMGLQQIAVGQGSSLIVENIAKSPALSALQPSLKTLQVESLAAVLLREGDQPIGLLVLEQCGSPRAWRPNELAGLEALADQVVLSVTNVRLRNLMKTLAVTDEHSGLLHRESYIPCLLSEAERMRAQKAALTGALLHFSRANQEPADAKRQRVMEEFVQNFSSAFVGHLRQNDIAARYGPRTLALILPGATGKEAVVVVEKLRKLAMAPAPAGAGGLFHMAALIGEAVQEREMENVDVVTELINRLDKAVDAAERTADNSTRLLVPPTIRP
ncbi:MAG: hypothetical protein A3H28_06260 [Acidobacteria bacterium RIFCSPLOWO2_02_FULL_61_28]|nr:MAG: hypothetical protein A3H28_06260 [Acidobacteria bacterium RIFCSPLOWO2_02_FULL_61_28]